MLVNQHNLSLSLWKCIRYRSHLYSMETNKLQTFGQAQHHNDITMTSQWHHNDITMMRSFFEQLRFLEVQPVVYHAMPLSWGSLPSDIICLVAFSASHHRWGSTMIYDITRNCWPYPKIEKRVQQSHPSPSHWLNPQSDFSQDQTPFISLLMTFPISNVYNWPTLS